MAKPINENLFHRVVDILSLDIVLFDDAFKPRKTMLNLFSCNFLSCIFNTLSIVFNVGCRLRKRAGQSLLKGDRNLSRTWMRGFLNSSANSRTNECFTGCRMTCCCQSLDPDDKRVFFVRRQSLSMGMLFLTCATPLYTTIHCRFGRVSGCWCLTGVLIGPIYNAKHSVGRTSSAFSFGKASFTNHEWWRCH